MPKSPRNTPELISKIISTAIFGFITLYLLIQLLFGSIIVTPQYIDYNFMISILVVALMAVITIIYGIRPIVIPRMKPVQLVAGLAMLFLAHGLLFDQPDQGIFARDIVKLVGIALVLLTPTHVLSPQTLVQAKKESKIEIIEV